MALISVTKEGTYYKGKKYSSNEYIPTNRFGGSSIGGPANDPNVQTVVLGSPNLTEEQALQVKAIQQNQIVSTGQNISVIQNKNNLVLNPDGVVNSRVVVSGRPEINNDSARKILEYNKQVRGRIEIRDKKDGNIIVAPSSVDALNNNLKRAENLNNSYTTLKNYDDSSINSNNNSSSNSSLFIDGKKVSEKEKTRIEKFKERIDASSKRQEDYFNSPGFQRIKETSELITPSFGKPYEYRNFIGKTAVLVTEGAIGLPFYLAGGLLSAGEKAVAVGEALIIPSSRELIGKELKRSGEETIKIFNPTTPEGASTFISAGVGAGFTAPGMMKSNSGLKYRTLEFSNRNMILVKQPEVIKSKSLNVKTFLNFEEVKTELPVEKISTLSYETTSGNSFIIASKTAGSDLTVFKSAPNIIDSLKTLSDGTEIKISDPTTTKILEINLANNPDYATPRAQEFIPITREIIKDTIKVNNLFQKNDFLTSTERLPEQGVKIALNVAKQYKGSISGSFSRSSALANEFNIGGELFVLNKIPRDIDIHLRQTPFEIEQIAQKTTNMLNDAGIKARLKGEGGQVKNAIEVLQPNGEWTKAIEFLGDGTLPVSEAVPDMVLGFKKTGRPIKVNKIKATSLNEELRGVTQGIARVRKGEGGKIDIYPPEKRVKDIGSVTVSSRTLQMSKIPGNRLISILPRSTKNVIGKKLGPVIGNKKLLGNIEKLESMYPKELVTEQLKTKDDVLLADFSGSSVNIKSSNVVPIKVYGPKIETHNSNSADKIEISSAEKNNIVSSQRSAISTTRSSLSVPSSNSSALPNRSLSPSYSPNRSTNNSSSQTPSKAPSSLLSPSSIIPSIINSPSPIKSSSSSKSVSSYNFPSPSSVPPAGPPERSPPRKRMFDLPSLQSNKKGNFVAEVKKKGKFTSVGVFNTPELAFSKAKFNVSNTASASLRVRKLGGGVVSPRGFLGNQFSLSKSSPGVLVEKRGQRIKSAGELQEITYKGVMFNKIKKQGKSLFGGRL